MRGKVGAIFISLSILLIGIITINSIKNDEIPTTESQIPSDLLLEKKSIEKEARHDRNKHVHSKTPKQKKELVATDSFNSMGVFDDSPIGNQLDVHLNLLEDSDFNSQEKVAESLEKMRKNPTPYIKELTRAYSELDRIRFLERYKIVFMLEHINSKEAEPFLLNLASSPMPTDIKPYEGHGQINEPQQENLIRMRAVGGLLAIAKAGSESARSALMDVINNTQDRTTKSDAIRAYLETSKKLKEDSTYLKQILSKDEQSLVTLEIDDVEEKTAKIK